MAVGALLKWLILVFDLLEEDAVLSRLYSTLFALLDVLYLRPRLCHLVAKITRRKHISSARCQFLKRLTDGITTEPNLYKLSAIFETLDPSSNGAPKSKLPIRFPHPDPHWIENLRPILRSHRPPAEWLPPSPDGFTFYGLPPSESNGAEIGRQPYGPLNLRNSDDLVSHLEGLQESDLESSALISSLSLHAVSLTKTGFHSRQMNATIANLLENQRQELEHVRRLSESLLDRLLAYTRSTKELHPATLEFLRYYLPKWRPAIEFERQEQMVDLLAYLPILPWPELYKTLLQPFERGMTNSAAFPLSETLDFYNNLLSRWIAWLSSPVNQPLTKTQIDTIVSLTHHTAILALTTLCYSPSPTQQTVSVILTHLEILNPLLTPPLSIPLPPPQPLLIYTLLFSSPTLSTISRVSALLASDKTAFEHPMPLPPPPPPHPDPQEGGRGGEGGGEAAALTSSSSSPATGGRPTSRPPTHIHTLNATLIDTCNLLLRSRAFNTSDAHALGCLAPPGLVASLTRYAGALSPPLDLNLLFSLSYHPSLSVVSKAAFAELEGTADVKHAGPVNSRSLAGLAREGGVRVGWREYRVHVLKWLEAMGVDGIGNLGRATMRGLMGGESRSSMRDSGVTKVG
ncbi:MAG: hypothetical protein OHK93_002973 [Ramalina farinacea]|uniref:Uncharacterized protein n=1 Tax=Ramalina farinacea TaxID=258253 RepID=A0AA43TXQ2_9LECA|nr:hypothetical protein [Ramalina farinacea]